MVSQPLANVLDGLDGPRGPDVVHRISVPGDWLRSGGVLAVALPRNLACAACDGGGCDACVRAGAISLRQRGAPPETVTVLLEPEQGGAGADLCLRISARGGHARESGLPRGNLMLVIREGDVASQGVELQSRPMRHARVADAGMIRRIGLGGLALCVLFYLMLRLSGWL